LIFTSLQIYQLFNLKTLLRESWFIILLFLLSHNSYAEKFSRIDSVSIHTDEEVHLSINALVAYCEKYATTDLERVRFYFVWVATHIQYDEYAVGNDKQNLESIFKNKKAVCSGYTRLLSYLCEQSGISARYVSGYGKEPNDPSNIQNHAWNVIRIDGQWYLFDVTWAADELEDDTHHLLPPAFESWFMPYPEVFQTTHLPFDPAYQLTTHLMTRQDFFSKNTQQALYTEGGVLPVSELDFLTILNEEITLDSLERAWRSLKRGYNFMPMDSAVAIKLAKTQDAKVKQAFAFIQEFSQNDYPKIRISSTETIKNDLSKLEKLEKPIAEALDSHAELETLPLSEDNKRAIKQNHTFYQNLVAFTQKAIKELHTEIEARE
jgi:hypothetical protein